MSKKIDTVDDIETIDEQKNNPPIVTSAVTDAKKSLKSVISNLNVAKGKHAVGPTKTAARKAMKNAQAAMGDLTSIKEDLDEETQAEEANAILESVYDNIEETLGEEFLNDLFENAGTEEEVRGKKDRQPTSQAPARKGDKRGDGDKLVKLPTTKVGMIGALNTKLAGMNKETLTSTYKKMMEDVSGVEFDESDTDFDDDLDAIVSEEATLSEDFKSKASLIMEAAVSARVKAEVAEVETRLNEAFEAEVADLSEAMTENVGAFLDHVAEQYMEDNELAIRNGLRTEISEDFMGKLHTLFTESFIEVPESKVDLVDSLSEENDALRNRLDASIETQMEADKILKGYKRKAIVNEASTGLTDTQAEKLLELSEGVDFVNEEDFSEKVETLVESYFSETVKTKTSDLMEETQLIEDDDNADNENNDPNDFVAMTLKSLQAKR